MKRVKCVVPRDKLRKNRIYTVLEETDENGSHFITVKEINNGVNNFFDWRFAEIPVLPKNIEIL